MVLSAELFATVCVKLEGVCVLSLLVLTQVELLIKLRGYFKIYFKNFMLIANNLVLRDYDFKLLKIESTTPLIYAKNIIFLSFLKYLLFI